MSLSFLQETAAFVLARTKHNNPNNNAKRALGYTPILQMAFISCGSPLLGGYYHPHFIDEKTGTTNCEVTCQVVSDRARKQTQLELRVPLLFSPGPTPSAAKIFLNCDFGVNNLLMASKVQAGPSHTLLPGPLHTTTTLISCVLFSKLFSLPGSVPLPIKWANNSCTSWAIVSA